MEDIQYYEDRVENSDYCAFGDHLTGVDECMLVFNGSVGIPVCFQCMPDCVGMSEEEEAEWFSE